MSKSRGRSRTARDMAALRVRDPGFLCAYCMVPLALPFPQTAEDHLAWEKDGWELYIHTELEPRWQLLDGHALAHRDHVHPIARGGPDTLDNMVLACERCNRIKKATPLLLFLALRARIPQFRSVGGTPATAFARGWAA